MKHAIMVLEEEKCRLRSLIRNIGRNMHELMQPIDFTKEQQELKDVEEALYKLNGGHK